MWLNRPTPFSWRGHQERGSVRSVAWALNKQGVCTFGHIQTCVSCLWIPKDFNAHILSFLIFSLVCVLKSQKLTSFCCVVHVSYWSDIASCFLAWTCIVVLMISPRGIFEHDFLFWMSECNTAEALTSQMATLSRDALQPHQLERDVFLKFIRLPSAVDRDLILNRVNGFVCGHF